MRLKFGEKFAVSLSLTIVALSLPCAGLGLDVSALPGDGNRPYETRTQLSGDADSYRRAFLLSMVPSEIDNFENAIQYYCDHTGGSILVRAFVNRVRSEFNSAMYPELADDASVDSTENPGNIMYNNASDYTEYGDQWRMGMPVYGLIQRHRDVYNNEYFVNLINTLRTLVDRIHSRIH